MLLRRHPAPVLDRDRHESADGMRSAWADGPSVFASLGGLAWAEGAYPTPHGAIRVRHDRGADGGIVRHVGSPAGVTVELLGSRSRE